jgi:cyclopropane fatty-acyl-phospholipid synthase-like methyltransferase
VRSVVEFGCGDGAQLSLARYPSYLGLDVSGAALDRARARFSADRSKSFRHLSDKVGQHDLALSMEVLFHLVEAEAFVRHLERLFSAARRFVIIYASDFDDPETADQYRSREFSKWIAEHQPEWRLREHVRRQDVSPYSDFHVYERLEPSEPPAPLS